MEKIILMNCGARSNLSCTKYILDSIDANLGREFLVINLSIEDRAIEKKEKFELIKEADIFLISVSVYNYSLPGKTLEFLEELQAYLEKSKVKKKILFYAVSNCGKFTGESNRFNLKILKIFARKTSIFNYKGGLGIGGGGYILKMRDSISKNNKFMDTREKINLFSKYIKERKGLNEDLYSSINISEVVFGILSNINWINEGRKNKVSFYKLLNEKRRKIVVNR